MAEKSSTKSFIIGALIVAVAVLGYFVYQAQTNEPDLSIDVSSEGIDVETN